MTDPPLMERADLDANINRLTGLIVDACVAVHKELGPGFKEHHYEEALEIELSARGVTFERQHRVTVRYKGRPLRRPYRVDILAEKQVVVELKAVDGLTALHRAQLLSYLKATGCQVGLLVNFNATRLTNQIARVVATREE